MHQFPRKLLRRLAFRVRTLGQSSEKCTIQFDFNLSHSGSTPMLHRRFEACAKA